MQLQELRKLFPKVTSTNYRLTSPVDRRYNCIAWAAGVNDVWWEPDPFFQFYWPLGVERSYSIACYMRAYGTLGFTPCDSPSRDPNFQKVALYAANNVPTHAARQTQDGWWASKLGPNVDIEHELAALDGGEYGRVVTILRKPT